MNLFKKTIFLSSRIQPLRKIRLQIYEWGSREGYNIRVAEKCFSINDKTPYSDVEELCIKEVRDSDLFIALLGYGYGNTSKYDPTEISLLELEIFQAFLSKIPIKIFVFEKNVFSDRRQRELLYLLEKTNPKSVKYISKDRIFKEVKRAIEYSTVESFIISANNLIRYISNLCSLRHTIGQEEMIWKEVRFLKDTYNPEITYLVNIPDPKELKRTLHLAKSNTNYYTQLLYTWKVLHRMSLIPLKDRDSSYFNNIWGDALQIWSSAASWAGYHSHLLMGALAAQNSLLDIRQKQFKLKKTEENKIRVASTHAAISSLTYSIAKQLYTSALKKSLIKTVMQHLKIAEDYYDPIKHKDQIAGIYSIRGHALYQINRLQNGICELQKSLKLRGDPEKCPALLSDLGFMLSLVGNDVEAKRLLENGVEILEKCKRRGYTVRAKRKLAKYYFNKRNYGKALEQFLEADALARYLGADDQVSIGNYLIRKLRKIIGLKIGEIEVKETDEGYKYQYN